jgi:hypothetical protein
MSDTVVVGDAPDTVVVVEDSVEVLSVGTQGPPGPPGVSGDAHYEQAFTNQSTVTVNHNLGKRPAVTVIDSAGDEVEGDVDHTSANALTVSFASATGGTVICN